MEDRDGAKGEPWKTEDKDGTKGEPLTEITDQEGLLK
jgi:hypothetical protein